MKKILSSGFAITLLLAGCGSESKPENNTTSKPKEEKYISDEKVKKEFQKTIDAYSKELMNIQQSSESGNAQGIIATFEESGNKVESAAQDFKMFLDNNKEPVKYEKPSESMVKFGEVLGKFIGSTSEVIKKVNDGKMSKEEGDKKFEELNNDMETQLKDIDDVELKEFMDKEGIKYDSLELLAEDDNSVDENANENEEDTFSLNPLDDFKSKKKIDVNKVIKAGPAELTINNLELGEIKVTQDNEYNFSSTKAGENAQIVILDVTLKNTGSKPADYYADQAELMTSSGEQVEPNFLTGSDLVVEMKGPVKSTSKIVYELKETKVDDLTSVSYIAKPYFDNESGETLSEEQIIELPIK
ncbi:DUF4352 domain-containing protein [Macrococcoides canis]|uniref:DUF4352 domain-containing protein n=1 Tax=Macrococcoides canis TaxID=1855823 RepID=UPI0010609BD0|nr:DUF4352 domain-containing protein [Macrococcus canis]TDM43492.1 DUF4352 domain-containing protein [Macrococcus canis]